nr:hypothetical protein [Tanacetum cinerariifolium]
MGAMKGGKQSLGEDSLSNYALVIGDECMMFKDLSLALLGRVKEFASLANLKVAIGNEGFSKNTIKYMGELWVMLEFHSMETLNKFRKNISIASWFSQIINATSDFETEGRIAWVKVEGVPLKLWSGNTFRPITAKWGKFLDVDDQDDNCYHSKRICIYMKSGRSIKDEFNIIHRGKTYWIRANETAGWMSGGAGIINTENVAGNDSEVEVVQETFFEEEESLNSQDEGEKLVSHMDKPEDPFNIYPLLNKPKVTDGSAKMSGCSLKFPHGFTPTTEKDEASINEAARNNFHNIDDETKDNREKLNDAVSNSHVNSNNKEVGNDSSSLGHFKKSECPRTDGSILGLLEEVVKVGQVMGYNMEGCISNIDHHSILLRENHYDYGLTPFWKNVKAQYKKDLEAVDRILDSGQGAENDIRSRSDIILKLQQCEEIDSLEMAQKAKINGQLKGMRTLNSFMVCLTKKQNILSIQGVLVDGVWVDDPKGVKREFFDHFSKRFCKPDDRCATLRMDFPNRLHSDQRCDLEAEVTNEEIKGLCRNVARTKPRDLMVSLLVYFVNSGCNSSFNALIPKFPDANHVKDFRPISLIGSIYKIIAKISTNRLVSVLGGIVNEVQSAFVANRQILDGPFILNELFQWCKAKKKQALIFKIDFEKAYDSVRWDFLNESFFNGHEVSSKRASWVNWNKVIDPKEKGGLGVSSLYALNRGLMFKWVWRFLTQGSSLWARVIKAIHGVDGNIGADRKGGIKSCWTNIVNEVNVLSNKGINLMKYMRIRLGNGDSTLLWDDSWHVGGILKDRFPRVYALEACKSVTVGDKLAQSSLSHSFRRMLRGGSEHLQFFAFTEMMKQVILVPVSDRWTWTLNNSGEFSVASVRKLIDDKVCSGGEQITNWIRYVPNKVNIHAWKVMTNLLATKFNILRRGIDIDSISCVNCGIGVETTSHLFFTCEMAQQDVLLIAVYTPHDFKEKLLLWDYLNRSIGRWNGEVIIMRDFNEVRYKSDRFGTVFHTQSANAFNSFIYSAGLVEVSLGGCSFTWCHKSATKMSKLDRFLVSETLFISCPNISALSLERYLSDHRPILLRESYFDYGPTPFRFFHYWSDLEGFGNVVEAAWKEYPNEKQNANMMGKLKHLKKRFGNGTSKTSSEGIVKQRLEIVSKLLHIDKLSSVEMAQKAKVKWSIEEDENTSFFHGVINKKRNLLNIRSIMVDGSWVDEPSMVKMEFFNHFRNRFDKPDGIRDITHMEYLRRISLDKQSELEGEVSNDEIKRAVWDCRTDKAPGPDGFTFGFYRRFWYLIDNDVYAAVIHFFIHGEIPKGCNSSFIALIPKIPDANLVKDYRPISLIGSLSKIIAKILANRLVGVLGGIVNVKKQYLVFKVDFEKAYDSVRWDFLDDIFGKFGFGDKWRMWIQSCLKSSRGSIIINGSLTEEFQLFKWLKRGDSLSPFLFILVMESLHLSFQRVEEAKIFIGVHVESDRVKEVALRLGCLTLKTPFLYLGSKVGGSMSQLHEWDEVVERVKMRLSKWKMKSLSIGVPLGVLRTLESIRSHFFNGHALGSNKASWVIWKKVLSSKDKGGLGVSSLYALNLGLLFKWIWRFYTQDKSLWVRVIKAMYGDKGKIDAEVKTGSRSCWLNIVHEAKILTQKCITLRDFMRIKLGNGENTSFWEDCWIEDDSLINRFPRLYTLESCNRITVGEKMRQPSLEFSFRRNTRGGVEQEQLRYPVTLMHDVSLSPMADRWTWALENSREFTISSVRKHIDDKLIPGVGSKTRMITRWWDVSYEDFVDYDDWRTWIINLRLPSKNKIMLEEGVLNSNKKGGGSGLNEKHNTVADKAAKRNDHVNTANMYDSGSSKVAATSPNVTMNYVTIVNSSWSASHAKSSYVRVVIELQVDVESKDTFVVAVLKFVGEGFSMCTIVLNVSKYLKNPRQDVTGVQAGLKLWFNPIKQVYQPVSKKRQIELTRQEISSLNPFNVLNTVENDDDLGMNEGNSKLVEKGAISNGVSSSHETSSKTFGSRYITI